MRILIVLLPVALILLFSVAPIARSKPAGPRGRVIGIGGVFFKTQHPKETAGWYATHMGFTPDPKMGVVFPWKAADATRPDDPTYRTTWALFPTNTRYFEPSKSAAMINYIVDDLDAILARLQAEGVKIDPKRETDEAGRFAWIFDADGNKIELWEPAVKR